MRYKNESDGKQKVYIDGVTGPFVFLEPGEECDVRLDADQEVRALDVAPDPEAKKRKAAKNSAP